MTISVPVSIAFAIGASMCAIARPAVAQDVPKAEAATAPPPATSEPTSKGHRHGRKHDDAAKSEAANTSESAAKPDSAAAGDNVSKIDSNAVAVVKPPAEECRTVKPTGSRMPKKICATPEQWKEVDAQGTAGAKQLKQGLNDQNAAALPAPPL
jgi:hypothetical protein